VDLYSQQTADVLSLPSLLYLHQSSSTGFHWRTFSFPLGSRTVPVLQPQQLSANSNTTTPFQKKKKKDSLQTESVCAIPEGIRFTNCTEVRVRVTLQLTVSQSVSQSVSLGVKPNLGLLTRDLFFLKVSVLSFGGALSDERPGLSSVSLQSVYSQSTVVSQYLHKIFTYCVTHIWHLQYLPYVRHIYNKRQ
jgi:hypothetical protein